MDFETFRNLKQWTLQRAADELRVPGDRILANINASLISKHERSILFPSPQLVSRYAEVTEGAVTWDDWRRLRERKIRDGEIPKRPTRRKSAEPADAERTA